jgi:cysteine sulfinate desulfinase/cysteine desulfurase-like protein
MSTRPRRSPRFPFDYLRNAIFFLSLATSSGLSKVRALVYKKSIAFESVNAGGEQENGFRAGTVNMPGDLALAYALDYGLKNHGTSSIR